MESNQTFKIPGSMIASCRIYLFTYKRPQLLPRAVRSILNQTFTNWICELHNDSPEDDYPRQLIDSLNDPRFKVVNHEVNFGAVASFNLAFNDCAEDFVSLLEDDNWWEPSFLEEMITLLLKNQGVTICWSNMTLHLEKGNNEWLNTMETIWPNNGDVKLLTWPTLSQAMSALHSNSALVCRSKDAHKYKVPNTSLLNAVELIRERSFDHPCLFNEKPLANFAVTLVTNRTADPYTWIGSQVMLLASFINTSKSEKKTFLECLNFYRLKTPSPISNFFLANIFFLKKPYLFYYFNISDWIVTVRWLIKNILYIHYLRKYLIENRDIYTFLLHQTKFRYIETKAEV